MSILPLFSARMLYLRKSQGLTQQNIGDRINKKRNTVTGYETAKKMPDLDTVCLLAQIFDCSTDYLLGQSDSRHNESYVYCADNGDFAHYFKAFPAQLQPELENCFKAFYKLLMNDANLNSSDRITTYSKLFATIADSRSNIVNAISGAGDSMSDPATVTKLMAAQSDLKNAVSSILDQLFQSDMESAYAQKEASPSKKSAI